MGLVRDMKVETALNRMSRTLLALVLSLVALPHMAEISAQEYRIAHCLHGCPRGADADNHLLLRPIYALSYNTSNKAADWAAYRVTADAIGIASSLSRLPLADNFVEDTLREADFIGAEEIGLSRAQFVPLVDFAGTPYWNEVNFLTNTVARSPSLNRGAWYGLEWSIRNLVSRESDVFVVTGPIYKLTQEAPQLDTTRQHRVPDAFFKIVITETGRSAAFIFDQTLPVHVHHCELITSISEIEEATGLGFFPDVAQLDVTPLDSSLGCSDSGE